MKVLELASIRRLKSAACEVTVRKWLHRVGPELPYFAPVDMFLGKQLGVFLPGDIFLCQCVSQVGAEVVVCSKNHVPTMLFLWFHHLQKEGETIYTTISDRATNTITIWLLKSDEKLWTLFAYTICIYLDTEIIESNSPDISTKRVKSCCEE